MKRLLWTLSFLAVGVLLSTASFATELVYSPVNPSFGGNPLNGSWMLGQAQAQNKFADSRGRYSREPKTALQRMTEDIIRRAASRTEREILDAIFDQDFSQSTADFGTYGSDLYTDEITINIDVYQYGDGNSAVIDSPY